MLHAADPGKYIAGDPSYFLSDLLKFVLRECDFVEHGLLHGVLDVAVSQLGEHLLDAAVDLLQRVVVEERQEGARGDLEQLQRVQPARKAVLQVAQRLNAEEVAMTAAQAKADLAATRRTPQQMQQVVVRELVLLVLVHVHQERTNHVAYRYRGDVFELDSADEVSEDPRLGRESVLEEDRVHHLDIGFIPGLIQLLKHTSHRQLHHLLILASLSFFSALEQRFLYFICRKT